MKVTRRLGSVVLLFLLAGSLQAQTKSGTYLAIVSWTHITPSDGGVKTCIIVGSDGQYHMETIDTSSKAKDKGKPHVSTGFLPDEYFEQFQRMVEAKELIALGSPEPPAEMVFQRETDAIVLSVHRGNGAQDLMQSDFDGKHPVARAVSAFVPWLKQVKNFNDFLVKDAEPNSCRILEPTGDYLPQLVKR